jgi:hypothetical protein
MAISYTIKTKDRETECLKLKNRSEFMTSKNTPTNCQITKHSYKSRGIYNYGSTS